MSIAPDKNSIVRTNSLNRTIIDQYKCDLCDKTTNCKIGLSLHYTRWHKFKAEDKIQYMSKYANCQTQFELELNKKISASVRKEIFPGMTKTQLGILKAKERLSNIITPEGITAYEKMIKDKNRKAADTQKKNGHFDKLSKLLKERQLTVHEDGLNEAQRRAKLTIETKRNTIDPTTGESVLISSIKKGIKTMRAEIGEDGLSKMHRRAINAAITKTNDIDENGFNGHQRPVGKIFKNRKDKNGNKNCWSVNIGKNETKILDEIEQKEGIKILRSCNIGNYFLDGYCEETNTAYEVNEAYHYASKEQIEKDKEREEKIKKVLNCTFVVIKDLQMEQ